MLNIYARKRTRRVWSPGTIAVSVGAHLLLLAGAVSVGVADHKHQDEPAEDITWIEPKAPEAPKPVEATPPPPAPERPDQPRPTQGDHAVLPEPAEVPTEIPPPNLDLPPTKPEDYSGIGNRPGDIVTEKPQGPPTPPRGNTTPPGEGNGPLSIEMVEELPALSNRSEAERLFRRHYPPLLRESGVTGRTTVLMVIDAEGRVEPGSVTVQESTHDAFREPAVKVAEKLRFRPAKLNGRAVPVLISVPIDWKLES